MKWEGTVLYSVDQSIQQSIEGMRIIAFNCEFGSKITLMSRMLPEDQLNSRSITQSMSVVRQYISERLYFHIQGLQTNLSQDCSDISVGIYTYKRDVRLP
jgi:hypothetical protein